MNIQKHFLQELEENGLWIEEAEAILDLAMKAKTLEPIKNRWLDEIETYPVVIKVQIWMAIKLIAREWLKANAPNHFAMSNFEN